MKEIIALTVFGVALIALGCVSSSKVADKVADKVLDTAISEVAGEINVWNIIKDKSYIVKKGDCLWNISKKQYNDPFLWWAIYKNNRDVIGDNPDIIEIDEVLNVKKVLTNDEQDTCKQKAYVYGEK